MIVHQRDRTQQSFRLICFQRAARALFRRSLARMIRHCRADPPHPPLLAQSPSLVKPNLSNFGIKCRAVQCRAAAASFPGFESGRELPGYVQELTPVFFQRGGMVGGVWYSKCIVSTCAADGVDHTALVSWCRADGRACSPNRLAWVKVLDSVLSVTIWLSCGHGILLEWSRSSLNAIEAKRRAEAETGGCRSLVLFCLQRRCLCSASLTSRRWTPDEKGAREKGLENESLGNSKGPGDLSGAGSADEEVTAERGK
jgi:hypothetical protein